MVRVFFYKNELIKLIPRVCHKIGAALKNIAHIRQSL